MKNSNLKADKFHREFSRFFFLVQYQDNDRKRKRGHLSKLVQSLPRYINFFKFDNMATSECCNWQ